MTTIGEDIPRQSTRAILGNGCCREAPPSEFMPDFRAGENFNHLKLAAEKMMQVQAGVKSDLQILKTKLQNSDDRVRTLESKLQEMSIENARLKVKHKQDMKLWKGLDSKFLSTTTFCDQLADTLQLLDCQVQEAEKNKNYLDDKLAERAEFFEYTECRLHDLLQKKEAAEGSLTQCESSNLKLQCAIREMEETILSDSIKFKTLAVEQVGLQHDLKAAMKVNEDNEAIIKSTRCEIQDLQNDVIWKKKEAADLQHQNLTLMQGKGELELEVKDLQSQVATTLKDNEATQQELEICKVKIADLKKVNVSAAVNIDNLLAEKAKLTQQSEKDKVALGKEVNELNQYLVEHKLDLEATRHQLQEAIKENERLVDVVGEEVSKFASLQVEINRMHQECTEKSERISCLTQNAECLKREHIIMMEEQLTRAEDVAKSLKVKFDLQLESQQEESSKRIDDISQRYNQEIADTRRKTEAEIKETIAKERLKGEDALKVVKQASDEAIANELEAFNKRWLSAEEGCERRIINLREGHEEEKMKIVSIHDDQLHKKQEELQRLNDTIKNLREGHEDERTKIVSTYADEIHRKEEELHKMKETMSKIRDGHEEEKTRIVSSHCDEIHKMEEELHDVTDTIRKIREVHAEEKRKMVSVHSDETHKMEEEIHNVKETISKLRAVQEEENRTIVSSHSDEIHKLEAELRKRNEKHGSNIAQLHDLQRKIREIRQTNREETAKFHQDYQSQLQKITEENSGLHKAMKKLQLAHEEFLVRKEQEQKAQLDKLEKDQQVQIHNMQNSVNRDRNENFPQLRSKTFGWEIQNLKETLQQITAKEVPKEDKSAHEDVQMTVTEDLLTKDIPASIVTPITQDKEPQQPNRRFQAAKSLIIHLADSTDEDTEEEKQKQTPQRKDHMHQSPRSGKRKVDLVIHSPPEEAPMMNCRTAGRRKASQDIQHKKAMQQQPTSTNSTKVTEDGSSGNKMTSRAKDNEARVQLLPLRQISMNESRRKTGTLNTGTQECDLHPMPGQTQQKGLAEEKTREKKTDPKRRGRKSTKDVSKEKTQLTKVPSPTISDLFRVDGPAPKYYEGDDPYALD